MQCARTTPMRKPLRSFSFFFPLCQNDSFYHARTPVLRKTLSSMKHARSLARARPYTHPPRNTHTHTHAHKHTHTRARTNTHARARIHTHSPSFSKEVLACNVFGVRVFEAGTGTVCLGGGGGEAGSSS